MRIKRVAALMGILLVLSQSACSNNSPADNPVDEFEYNYDLISGEKDGECHFGYFIQEDCVTDVSDGKYMFSTYDSMELDVVCMNPVCTHKEDSSCTALVDEKAKSATFSVVYNNKLIIVCSYDNQLNSEEYVKKTDVYESELDGSNRKCVLSFEGNCENNAFTNSTLLVDGKLYFAGDKHVKYISKEDASGLPAYDKLYEYGIYCVDLNDYSVKELHEGEGELGICNWYVHGDYVYASIGGGNTNELYRISVDTGNCELVFKPSEKIIFCGAIGETIYYIYQNSSISTVHSRVIGSEEESVFKEDIFHVLVMDECVYVMNTSDTYTNTQYHIYDVEGNLLDTIEYDQYMYFCGDVGDKVVYYTMTKVGVVNKEDLRDVFTKGQDIGTP